MLPIFKGLLTLGSRVSSAVNSSSNRSAPRWSSFEFFASNKSMSRFLFASSFFRLLESSREDDEGDGSDGGDGGDGGDGASDLSVASSSLALTTIGERAAETIATNAPPLRYDLSAVRGRLARQSRVRTKATKQDRRREDSKEAI